MTKIVICGGAGRMGQAILALALKNKNLAVAGLVEAANHPLTGRLLNGVPVRTDLAAAARDADVVIDFTAPESTARNAGIVGTTGLEGKLRQTFLRGVRKIPVVFSPNMSLGANVLFDAVERLARLLPAYDAEISEIHHNLKKDAPSGTARRLAESVVRARGKSAFLIFGRNGLVGARKPGEVGVHALRGGDVVGDHTVFFMGPGERVELTHRAASRDAFAAGALTAAQWVVRQKPGLYDMSDVLGLKLRK
jgi:4-hydroxy-tetrahydrodipicolinate reductase